MSYPWRQVAQVSLLAALLSCGAVNDAPFELPAPDASRDPAALRVGSVLYRCGTWVAGAPAGADWLLVDIFFGQRDQSDPSDRPVSEHRARVEASGGRVLHEFAFPAVRAHIHARRIPALTGGGLNPSVHAVPDPRRFDWRATVVYREPLSAAHEARIRALGGRVEERLSNLTFVVVTLPGASFAPLRADPAVAEVDASGQVCPP